MNTFFIVFVLLNVCSRSRVIVSCDAAEVNWIGRSSTSNAVTVPLSVSQRIVTAIKVAPTGQVYSTQILKQQLANELNVPLRDLRVVDPSLPNQIQATFTARPKAILFCLENIKVVVQNHEALVFSPTQREVQEFIPILQQNIIQNNDIIPTLDPLKKMRFEHVVLESALSLVCSNLFQRVRRLAPLVDSTLKGLRTDSHGLDLVQKQVDELLPLKNQIDELRKRVKEIKRAITEVLNSDEDMKMMFLSRSILEDRAILSSSQIRSKPTISIDDRSAESDPSLSNPMSMPMQQTTQEQQDHNDIIFIETLFETYLNEIEWISSDLEEFNDEIVNTEENVVLQLDILRNRILRFELNLSILSFVGTCGAFITGLFGMNLMSHLETKVLSFYVVSICTFFGCTVLFYSLRKFAKQEKLF